MSKIEIMSKFGNVGDVNVNTRKGETKTITFKAVAGGSVALVDEDVAEVLLDDLSHEYHKPGAIVVESGPAAAGKVDKPAEDNKLADEDDKGKPADDSKPADSPESGKTADPPDADPAALTLESYATITNFQSLKAQLKKVTESALVMELVAIETQGKNRESFVKLLNERLDELKAA